MKIGGTSFWVGPISAVLSAILLTAVACGGEAHRTPANTAGSGAIDGLAGGSDSGSSDGGSSSAGTGAAAGRGATGGSDASGASSGGGTILLPMPDPEKVPQCFQEMAAGNCEEPTTRYFYDPAAKKCREFTYSGCGGNDNNFASNAECVAFCWGDRTCKCDGTNAACRVVGACTECPVDPAIAQDESCATEGLTCLESGATCTCRADSGMAPTWHCRVKAQ